MTPYTLDHQHQLVLAFMEKANQETPQIPASPAEGVCVLRAKLIMEEALETIHALGVDVRFGMTVCIKTLKFVSLQPPDLVAVADGCADLKVVTVGTEIACGINGKPIFEEVMRSNFTKFIDGHMREDGKWQKGPSYEPPNLEPILKSQGMK